MTPNEIELVRKRYGIGPGVAKLNSANRSVSSSKSESPVRNALPPASERAKANSPRYAVRITSFRLRFCDPDNLCGKFFVDCLRYAGIIPDDTAAIMDYSIRQQKAASKAEERTEIEVQRI